MYKTAIGNGIYTLTEAAKLTRLSRSRVQSWFAQRPDTERAPVFLSDYAELQDHRVLSFHDLIDALVAGQLRGLGVCMQEVRRAYTILQEEWGQEHPLCMGSLFTEQGRIFMAIENADDVEHFVEVVSRQGSLGPVIAPYLRQIDFDDATDIAIRWHIHDGVVVDP